ncbi:hypothetical protein VSDG_08096 [Cytospora chrysosperma]|uniref:Cyanovirin-N domain-containing protein n=1 Tax=Cytospora chrysosperma TaxID=252740 RepID=A0A423VFF2_CYTCH|nr:hypothetical protein VSDG_08096 [Valsa sordida]
MIVSHIITTVLSLVPIILALPKADVTLETKNLAANTTCWVGHIHGTCYGHHNGCTPDGIYVTCQANDFGGQMVFNNTCSPPGSHHGTLPGTCHCIESTGQSSC